MNETVILNVNVPPARLHLVANQWNKHELPPSVMIDNLCLILSAWYTPSSYYNAIDIYPLHWHTSTSDPSLPCLSVYQPLVGGLPSMILGLRSIRFYAGFATSYNTRCSNPKDHPSGVWPHRSSCMRNLHTVLLRRESRVHIPRYLISFVWTEIGNCTCYFGRKRGQNPT